MILTTRGRSALVLLYCTLFISAFMYGLIIDPRGF